MPQSMCQDAGNMGKHLYWFLVLLDQTIRTKHEKRNELFSLWSESLAVRDDDELFEGYVTGV